MLTIKSDPQWHTYLTFLYPSNETQNWMENEKTMEPMIKAGDSAAAMRDIFFETIFKTDTGRDAFAAEAVKRGYKIQKSAATAIAGQNVSLLTFSKLAPLQLDSLNVWTERIKQDVRLHGGIYNGWTAPVVHRK